jgi:ADP-heptose:LPS heptosyltransferase
MNEYEKFLNITDIDKKKFKIKYIDKDKFNVAIMLPDISEDIIKMLLYIDDITIFSFHSTKLKSIIDISEYNNSLKNLAIAIKNMHLIISTEMRIINMAKNLEIKTFALLNNELPLKSNIVKQYISHQANKFDKILPIVKHDADRLRLEIKEKSLLNKIEFINNDTRINRIQKCDLVSGVLFHDLYLINHNPEYLYKYIELQKELLIDKEYTNFSTDNIASCYYFFLGNKEEGRKWWKDFDKKIKEDESSLEYAQYWFNNKNFDKFFKYYPKMLKTNHKNPKHLYTCLQKPFWQGEKDIANKTLLLYFELGHGDTIMFSRYINKVQTMFKHIVLVLQKELKTLFQTSFPNIEIYSEEEFFINYSNINYDYVMPLMVLQTELKLSPINYPVGKYLTVDKNKIEEFKKYFDSNKINIGVFWESQQTKIYRESDIETFMPLTYIDNVKLYSLHINKTDIELNYIDDNIEIINLGKHFKDFSDTAAAIENCDLVISTDCSVMNLAGALGKKTFALFSENAEWRWYKLDGEDVDWYKTVKPFQAKEGNNFKPLIEQICKIIQEKRF